MDDFVRNCIQTARREAMRNNADMSFAFLNAAYLAIETPQPAPPIAHYLREFILPAMMVELASINTDTSNRRIREMKHLMNWVCGHAAGTQTRVLSWMTDPNQWRRDVENQDTTMIIPAVQMAPCH